MHKQLPKVFQYVEDVKSGKIITGELIKLAVQRFEKDLLRDDLTFIPSRVNKVITFIFNLKHFTGKFNNKPFILEPWEEFIVANLYGFYWKETGKRRFTEAQISVARKNGKTQLIAALSIYELICGEADTQVYLAANSRDQAKVAFNACSKFSIKLDNSQKRVKAYRNEVKYKNGSGNQIKVIASDSSKLDGLNCSFVCLDEYAAAPNSLVADVLLSSMAMRDNPMFISISTSGFDKTSPFYLLRGVSIEILHGVKVNDNMFCAIYELDEGDDWKNPEVWIKANPNLNITVQKSFLEGQIIKATNDTSTEVGIMTKNFNLWCDSSSTWIPGDRVLKNTGDIKTDDFKGSECYVGIDLASTCDITAVSTMFERDDKFYFFFRFYIPEDSMNTNKSKEQYKIWERQGYLIKTPGNVCDYQFIENDLLELDRDFDLKKICYDAWNSTQFIISCTDSGLNQMEAFSGTVGNFSKATKTFERLILSDQIVLENNPIIRWMIGNTFLRMDSQGNVKPSKINKGSESKIDGVISALEALGGYLNDPHFSVTVN